MAAVDSYLGREREQGALDSSGAFTVDPRRALEFSRLTTQPRHYAVLLVALAVLQGASQFDLRLSPGRAAIRFNGRPLEAEMLESLSSSLFSSRSGPSLVLARALQAAMGLSSLKCLRLHSGSQGAELRGRSLSLRPAPSWLDGTRIEVAESLQLRGLIESPWQRTEVASLLGHCRWAPLCIRVNDRPLWDGPIDLGEAVLRVRLTHPQLPVPECRQSAQHHETSAPWGGLFWFCGEAQPLARVTLVENGISYGPVAWDLGVMGCEGVLVSQDLPKDLSLLQLRHDPEILEQLRRQLGQELLRVGAGGPPPRPIEAIEAPGWRVQRAISQPLRSVLLANGSRLAVLGPASVQLWETASASLLTEVALAAEPECSLLAFLPHIPWLLAGGSAAVLLHTERGDVVCRWSGLSAAAFRPDGGLLACARIDGALSLHRLPSGRCVREWKAHSGPVGEVGWHPQGEWLFSRGQDGKVHVWSLEGGLVASPTAPSQSGVRVEFSPSGDLLAVGGLLYRCPGQEVHPVGQSQSPAEIHFLLDGELLARFFKQRRRLEVRRSHDGHLFWSREDCHSLLVSNDRRLLALGMAGGLEVTELDGSCRKRLPQRSRAVALDPRWLLCQDLEPPLLQWESGASRGLGELGVVLDKVGWTEASLVATGSGRAYRLSPAEVLCHSPAQEAWDNLVLDSQGLLCWSGKRLSPFTAPLEAQVDLRSDRVVMGSRHGLEVRRVGEPTSHRLSRRPVAGQRLSDNGRRLGLTHRGDPNLEIWDLDSLRRLVVEKAYPPVWALSQEGSLLALGNPLRILSVDSPEVRARFSLGPCQGLYLNETHVVLAGPLGTHLFRFQLAPAQTWLVALLDYSAWKAVAFQPGGARLAGLDVEGRIHFVRLDTGQRLATFHPMVDRWEVTGMPPGQLWDPA
jgi:hypothetical protein